MFRVVWPMKPDDLLAIMSSADCDRIHLTALLPINTISITSPCSVYEGDTGSGALRCLAGRERRIDANTSDDAHRVKCVGRVWFESKLETWKLSRCVVNLADE